MEANLMCEFEICEMGLRKLVRGWRAGFLMVGGRDGWRPSTELNCLIWQHVTQVSLPSNTVSAHRLHNGSVHSPVMRAFMTSKQQETEAIKAARPEEPQPSSLAHHRMHSADCQHDAWPDLGGKTWQNNGCKWDRNDCAPRTSSWFVLQNSDDLHCCPSTSAAPPTGCSDAGNDAGRVHVRQHSPQEPSTSLVMCF